MTQPQFADRPDPVEMRRRYAEVTDLARRGGFRKPATGWTAEQVLAHLLATTRHFVSIAEAVKRGERPDVGDATFVDDEVLQRSAEGLGVDGLSAQLDAASVHLVAEAESLTDAEAGTQLRFTVHHDGATLVDAPQPWGQILAGHASFHLPLHVDQLRALTVPHP